MKTTRKTDQHRSCPLKTPSIKKSIILQTQPSRIPSMLSTPFPQMNTGASMFSLNGSTFIELSESTSAAPHHSSLSTILPLPDLPSSLMKTTSWINFIHSSLSQYMKKIVVAIVLYISLHGIKLPSIKKSIIQEIHHSVPIFMEHLQYMKNIVVAVVLFISLLDSSIYLDNHFRIKPATSLQV